MRALVTVDPKAKPRPYILNLGEATSQMLAAIIGCDANLTLSAMSGYWLSMGSRRGKILVPIIDFIFSEGHCKRAWEDLV